MSRGRCIALHCVAVLVAGVFRLCCGWFLVVSADRRGAREGRGRKLRGHELMYVEALFELGIWVWNCLYVSIVVGAVVRCGAVRCRRQ